MARQVTGADISENNEIEWDSMDGADFIIIRAGWGQGHLDGAFFENVKQAQARGLKMGAYWFSYALDPQQAEQEGRYAADIVNQTGALFELPIFYDQEGSNYRNRNGYDAASATEQCYAFMNGLDGLNSGVYANLDWFQNYLDYDRLYNDTAIWLAHYNDAPGLACGIWQYTDKGQIGNNYPLDLNTATL